MPRWQPCGSSFPGRQHWSISNNHKSGKGTRIRLAIALCVRRSHASGRSRDLAGNGPGGPQSHPLAPSRASPMRIGQSGLAGADATLHARGRIGSGGQPSLRSAGASRCRGHFQRTVRLPATPPLEPTAEKLARRGGARTRGEVGARRTRGSRRRSRAAIPIGAAAWAARRSPRPRANITAAHARIGRDAVEADLDAIFQARWANASVGERCFMAATA